MFRYDSSTADNDTYYQFQWIQPTDGTTDCDINTWYSQCPLCGAWVISLVKDDKGNQMCVGCFRFLYPLQRCPHMKPCRPCQPCDPCKSCPYKRRYIQPYTWISSGTATTNDDYQVTCTASG